MGHGLNKIFDQLTHLSWKDRGAKLEQFLSEGLLVPGEQTKMLEALAIHDSKTIQDSPSTWSMGSVHPIGRNEHQARVVGYNTADKTVTLWYGNDYADRPL